MKLSGWGNHPIVECAGYDFEKESAAAHILKGTCDLIPYGQGKSYGDSALAPNVLMTGRYNKILAFDAEHGIVTCESGTTLADLLDVFLSRGWFFKVTPGTKLISVGGAIASDVHGKNHHVAGCFSSSVLSLRLMLPNGEVVTCSLKENRSLFHATCGGMGLTGLILDATLQLRKVTSAYIKEKIIPCRNLEEIFEQFENNRSAPYSIAWIDCLSNGDQLGRSVLMVGDHADDDDLLQPQPRNLSVPITTPSFLLNRFSMMMFNQAYYYLNNKSAGERRVPLDGFFYPLDAVADWNRLYGKKGFTQYQCVLPKSASYSGVKTILETVAASGQGSFLAGLKLFGKENGNYLSFPMEGFTLPLDFKLTGRTFKLLDRLDRIVLDHGGRLYLTKDVRMPNDVFVKGYPRLPEFEAVRRKYELQGTFNSHQSRRIGLP